MNLEQRCVAAEGGGEDGRILLRGMLVVGVRSYSQQLLRLLHRAIVLPHAHPIEPTLALVTNGQQFKASA